MKKLIVILFAIGLVSMSTTSMASMSRNQVRKETRFLTDKMAYELNLSTQQYNDTYEINYDFIYNIGDLMDDVLDGDDWASDQYYQYLDIRNDDLRWVLTDWQYRQFLDIDYFYRPVYATGSSWGFRVYISYNNPLQFYFGRPYNYNMYSGGHYRTHYNNVSYYSNRYDHDIYRGQFSVKTEKVYYNNRRSDFGNVKSNRDNGNVRYAEPQREDRSSSRRSVGNDDMYNVNRSNNATRNDNVRSSGNNNSNNNGYSNRSSRTNNSENRGTSVTPSTRSNESVRPSSTRVSRENSSRSSENSTRVAPERKSSDNSSSESKRAAESSSNRDKGSSSDNDRSSSRSRR